ncbi:MAG TPA: hypothetical protein VF169_10125 [Albitalea sp.]|uniref:hypothetical protein n=1 Tax=Piscinibacter sp. TaxID=1903157 RepID=UPI002ED1406A
MIRPSPAGKFLYVNKVGSDGWLQARQADPDALLPLCKYTQVTLIETRNGRTSFKVGDGAAKGRTLSLSDANAAEYLGPKPPAPTPASIVVTYGKYVEGWVSQARNGQRLDQQMATLQVADITVQVSMNSVWGQGFTPLPAGEYVVLLPDAPHQRDMTRFYRRVAPTLQYDQVWFPIRHGDNSRYVHVGNLSDGCTTVLDLARWPDIHEALISHRSPDGKSVATLLIKGTPEREK